MWKVIDKHHMTNGIYTISKNISRDARVVKPYGLHKGNAKSGYVTIGYYATSKEANDMFNQLTGETK